MTALLEQASARDAARLADAKKTFRQLLSRANDPADGDAESLEECTALLWPNASAQERTVKVAETLQACREELAAYAQTMTDDESATLRQRMADAEADARAELRDILNGLLDAADLQALAGLVGPVAAVATPPHLNTGGGLLYSPDARAMAATARAEAALRAFAGVRFDVGQRSEAARRAEDRVRQIRAAHPIAFAAE